MKILGVLLLTVILIGCDQGNTGDKSAPEKIGAIAGGMGHDGERIQSQLEGIQKNAKERANF